MKELHLKLSLNVVKKTFAFKRALELVPSSAMLTYHMYAPLASSVHFAQSSHLLCEVPWSDNDPEYMDKNLVNKEIFEIKVNLWSLFVLKTFKCKIKESHIN